MDSFKQINFEIKVNRGKVSEVRDGGLKFLPIYLITTFVYCTWFIPALNKHGLCSKTLLLKCWVRTNKQEVDAQSCTTLPLNLLTLSALVKPTDSSRVVFQACYRCSGFGDAADSFEVESWSTSNISKWLKQDGPQQL